MIFASENSPRIAMIASSPFISGICKSIRVMSGRCARNCWIASSPLEACATNFISGWPLKRLTTPWRKIARSSTARIPIGLGRAFITLSPPKPGQGKAARIARLWVSARGWNCQFGFGAATGLAPNLESTSDEFGPFPHTTQAPMSGDVLQPENDWVDALTVIPNSEPQAVVTVSDVYLDSSGIGMTDRIAQRLRSNPIDLITNHRTQRLRCSLDLNPKFGTGSSCGVTQKGLAEVAHRLP